MSEEEVKHKCFISFKMEDEEYKRIIQEDLDINMIDKSLNKAIESEDEDYIMRKIREDYLSDSTVTICLLGSKSAENCVEEDQTYIKRELQASLYNGEGNTRNGILGIVLPEIIENVYKGKYKCEECGEEHYYVNINDDTTIREFNYNYYIPKDEGCCWTEEDRYCVLVKWKDFKDNPEKYINQAFDKRSVPIADKIKVRP